MTKLQRMGAVALAVALLGVGGVANADTGPQLHQKCHTAGQSGKVLTISPAARSYMTQGHGTRSDADSFKAITAADGETLVAAKDGADSPDCPAPKPPTSGPAGPPE